MIKCRMLVKPCFLLKIIFMGFNLLVVVKSALPQGLFKQGGLRSCGKKQTLLNILHELCLNSFYQARLTPYRITSITIN